MWGENPAASQDKPALNLDTQDVSMFCIERRSSSQQMLKILPRISGNHIGGKHFLTFWDPTKNSGSAGRSSCPGRPRLGSRGATGRPGGRMLEVFKEGSCTNQMEHNGLPPTPYRAHCWPLCVDMYVQKERFKDQEVFLCRSSHCQDFPPPSPPPRPSSHCTTGHVIYNLNGMTVMEPCVYVEPGGGSGRGEEKKTVKHSGPPFVHTSSARPSGRTR